MHVPTEAISPEDHARWVAEHAIDDRTASAVIDAIRQAHAEGIGHPTIDHIRAAAVARRAKLRLVAACLGYLRCECCHAWIDLRCEPDEGGCLHVGESDHADVYAALQVWQAVGGPLDASHTMPYYVAHPERVSERLKRLTGAGGDHAPESCC